MSTQYARPAFGAPKRNPDYYAQTRAYVESLRSTTTMREIARKMNQLGWTTPSGLIWTRQAVMNLMRKQSTN